LKAYLSIEPDRTQGTALPTLGYQSFQCFTRNLFLAYQRDMQRKKGKNNAQGLFGIEQIPSDGQIRNLLDPVEATQLREPFREICCCLDERGFLAQYAGVKVT